MSMVMTEIMVEMISEGTVVRTGRVCVCRDEHIYMTFVWPDVALGSW